MIWRESLPARVAMATAGLLTLILLTITASAYVITALLLQQGVDSALSGTLLSAEPRSEHNRWEREDELPFDPEALEHADRRGQTFVSLVEEDGMWVERTGPDWWQALTPAKDEVRVMYARGRRGELIRAAAPMESAHEVLPTLLRSLILLSIIGVLLSAAIAWKMAGQTYKPLKAVIATTEDISAHSLALRVPDLWHDRTIWKLTGVLNAMIARLQAAFDAQGRFVAAAAHELRGPLGAMRAELEVTLRRERTPEEYRTALQGALMETARLSALSEHLLMLARGGALARETGLQLAAVMEQAAEEVRRATGGEVQVSAPGDLRIDGDPLALERMLSNLTRNGVEAGGAPVSMQARRAEGGGVEIIVRDRGPGIAAEALPHIFEPFYRADAARSRDGGTGLGLAIVKTVVDAHGGKVRVDSAPGQGTAFYVWLPGA
ncbi:MAG TPA: ATP-binding protein [Symbiobacteriaceae bacterium]|nr:ATP-binding protein [Symbiobacteriaceae bacterium]